MPVTQPRFTITFGGWYQRTTLHLSEIYDLFALGHSGLKLDQATLTTLHQKLDFVTVTREWGELEYIKCLTSDGIEVRYYEDGLYVLIINSTHIVTGQKKLREYYDNSLAPAISYIFSLGAPTPKVLANIRQEHPTVVSAYTTTPKTFFAKLKFGPVYSQITSPSLSVYKTPAHIIILSKSSPEDVNKLIEMQIFFREFKDQLHRYLNLHREIWEEISDIKERGSVSGREVESLRARLDSYQKTINLIKSRLNQMGTYVRTRASIAKKLELEDQLASVFQYKFETLTNTHSYVQDIWKMTQDYVDTAIQVINEVKAHSTSNGINSLRLITTIGVLSGIFGYLSKDQFPTFTLIGLWYFLVLVLGTWIINQAVTTAFRSIHYRLKFANNQGIK
ncbi:hypothetical protein HYV64_00640 [Candidatus Shapirobacteria bacterium]|nr:hypothetical protein [Candidatus Shapirobacteria bacterium]